MNEALFPYLFWMCISCFVISFFYPRNFKVKQKLELAFFPIAGIILFIAYNITISEEYNIRVDLFLSIPLLVGSLIALILKLRKLQVIQTNGSAAPDRESKISGRTIK